MTRLNALESTSGVVTGRRPLKRDAKAYLTAKETRNLNIPFGESPLFRGGRRSKKLPDCGPNLVWRNRHAGVTDARKFDTASVRKQGVEHVDRGAQMGKAPLTGQKKYRHVDIGVAGPERLDDSRLADDGLGEVDAVGPDGDRKSVV